MLGMPYVRTESASGPCQCRAALQAMIELALYVLETPCTAVLPPRMAVVNTGFYVELEVQHRTSM